MQAFQKSLYGFWLGSFMSRGLVKNSHSDCVPVDSPSMDDKRILSLDVLAVCVKHVS